MRSIEEVKKEYEEIQSKMRPLEHRWRELYDEINLIESTNFIKVNGVTKDNVETCSGEGKPYFSTISHFQAWLRNNSDKKFCEWNGRILFRNELINGAFDRDSKARYDDLED